MVNRQGTWEGFGDAEVSHRGGCRNWKSMPDVVSPARGISLKAPNQRSLNDS